MPIRYRKTIAALQGTVSVEDAEQLSLWLAQTPKAAIRLDKVEHVHCAVLQVLLARRPAVRGNGPGGWLGQVLSLNERTDSTGEHS